MELLINQVGYDCDGHKIALLQTAADVRQIVDAVD